jgi:hypothetical protein
MERTDLIFLEPNWNLEQNKHPMDLRVFLFDSNKKKLEKNMNPFIKCPITFHDINMLFRDEIY